MPRSIPTRYRQIPHASLNITASAEESPMASNYYGGAAVGFVAHEFLRRGANVAFPLVDSGYDLVVLPLKGAPKKVQVKSRWRITKGNYQLYISRCTKSKAKANGEPRKSRHYEASICDFIVIADMTHNQDCWVLPVAKVRSKFRFEKNFYYNNWELVLQ